VASIEVSRFGMSAASITADPNRPSDVYANSYIYSITFTSNVGDVEQVRHSMNLSRTTVYWWLQLTRIRSTKV